MFYKESHCVGTKICAVDGDCWTDDEYDEWQNKLRQEKEEELNHQRELEKIRRQRKVDEEAELIKTRRANELFLARHQRNTPTQNYINKFCNRHSKVDFTDKEVIQEALEPEGINYELVQKHNSKLYREYLQTPLWKLISSKVKWNAHKRCEKCGSKSHLEIHHNSYEFKGVEFLDFKSLKCLCSKCHQEEHDKLDF